MRAELKLRIKCSNRKNAFMLEKVLRPDNRVVPKDQTIETRLEDSTLVISIMSERAGSALNSARSILEDAKLFSWLNEALGV